MEASGFHLCGKMGADKGVSKRVAHPPEVSGLEMKPPGDTFPQRSLHMADGLPSTATHMFMDNSFLEKRGGLVSAEGKGHDYRNVVQVLQGNTGAGFMGPNIQGDKVLNH